MELNRRKSTPIDVPRTNRVVDARLLTSIPAGKMTPLMAFPLLREDGVRQGKIRLSFESMETAEILMNAIGVRALAYLVPNLAFERFLGMDDLNRSYEGIPYDEGGTPTPYIERKAFGAIGANQIYKSMGLHCPADYLVNTAYTEAYNAIWNHRAIMRSPKITKRTRLQEDLAPAFWNHQNFGHIVPSFDQAVIDGEVALNIVNAKMPVKGLAIGTQGLYTANATNFRESGNPASPTGTNWADITGANALRIKGNNATKVPDIYAEMAANGITVSLSNIDMARKTAAFARLREQYAGHSDDYIINLLMDGITIPEQDLSQPILLGDVSTIFGMSKRYASDSGNLTESVVNGATFLDLNINTPAIGCGGVIMIVVEITPEQLFERTMDPYLMAAGVEDLPQFMRDSLDPEKVVAVPNGYVDTNHATPLATFGYAPLNHEWNMVTPRVGNRFYRPLANAGFDEDRQRIWAVETINPTLSEDFYLCKNMHTKPFVVTNQDPFEVVGRGTFVINGNTVFGGQLVEASNNYDKVLAEVPQERLQDVPQ